MLRQKRLCYRRYLENSWPPHILTVEAFLANTAQNPLSGEQRKTLSIIHNALSTPPSHHHLYIIHLINWLQRFYCIAMSLKRPFVPKSDVMISLPSKHGTLTNVGLLLINVADVYLTLKQHWVNVSLESYRILISSVADFNVVNLYSTGYCRPTRDRPSQSIACPFRSWMVI